MEKETPIVSVCIITYNHEEFIRQAIESVLIQQCSFPIEIVIGEDCSCDSTKDICLTYANMYPQIKVIARDKNIGMVNNFVQTASACDGKYIAMLEGDDFWTDPYKLQKQFDFLENNLDFVLCFHNRKELRGDSLNDKLFYNYDRNTVFVADEVFRANVHTLTVMFRNVLREHPYPKSYYNLPLYDCVLWPYLSLYGKCAYLHFTGATYRIHDNSVFSATDDLINYQRLLVCHLAMKKHFPREYSATIDFYIIMLYFIIAEELKKDNKNWLYFLNLIKLTLNSIRANNYEYLKYYKSYYKTIIKEKLKLIF